MEMHLLLLSLHSLVILDAPLSSNLTTQAILQQQMHSSAEAITWQLPQ